MTRSDPPHIWDRLITALFAIAAFWLASITLTTIWDVLARNMGTSAPRWFSTYAEFGLAISAIMAAPFLVRERAHVSMELIDSALSKAGRLRLILFTDIVCSVTSLVIAYFAASAGYTAWVRGEIDIQAIDVPRWIMFAVLTIGFTMCAIEFLRHLRRAFTQGIA